MPTKRAPLATAESRRHPSSASSYLDHSPAFLVTAAANRLTQRTNRILRAALGVSQPDWRVLAILAVEPGATPARIGEISGVDKSVVSRSIASLVQRALVAVELDPEHARRTRLFLTAAGQAVHDDGVVMTRAGDEQLLTGFDETERLQLTDFMHRLAANIARLAAPVSATTGSGKTRKR